MLNLQFVGDDPQDPGSWATAGPSFFTLLPDPRGARKGDATEDVLAWASSVTQEQKDELLRRVARRTSCTSQSRCEAAAPLGHLC